MQNNQKKKLTVKTLVSIVTNNFKNDSRVLKESISLKSQNYNVQVVALHEKNLAQHETIHGIPVYRLKLKSKNWPKKKIIHIIKYIEFIYRAVKYCKTFDIIHCNDLDTLPIGVIIKKFINKKVKLVYDAHEYESNSIHNQSKLSIKLHYWFEKSLIKTPDAVITVSHSIADEYVKLYNIKKPVLIFNAPHYKTIVKKNIFREKFGISSQQIIFLYQGGLYPGRGIENLLTLFKQLTSDKVIFFMGYGPLIDLVKSAQSNYQNIYYHPTVSPIDLMNYTSSADYGLLLYENSCKNHYYCMPNKLFEYCMAEIPLLVSNLHDLSAFVREHEIGVISKDATLDNLQKAMKNLLVLDKQILLENIKQTKKLYNWETQERKLLPIYQNL